MLLTSGAAVFGAAAIITRGKAAIAEIDNLRRRDSFQENKGVNHGAASKVASRTEITHKAIILCERSTLAFHPFRTAPIQNSTCNDIEMRRGLPIVS